MMNLDCAKCPTYNPVLKDEKIKEAMKLIQNSLIRDVLPSIQSHKFGKDVKSEVVAHVGGWNNSRATAIRKIRKFCDIPREETKSADKNLILID
jgi:hypothetical protein